MSLTVSIIWFIFTAYKKKQTNKQCDNNKTEADCAGEIKKAAGGSPWNQLQKQTQNPKRNKRGYAYFQLSTICKAYSKYVLRVYGPMCVSDIVQTIYAKAHLRYVNT